METASTFLVDTGSLLPVRPFYSVSPPQCNTKIGPRMTMVIRLSEEGLEGRIWKQEAWAAVDTEYQKDSAGLDSELRA